MLTPFGTTYEDTRAVDFEELQGLTLTATHGGTESDELWFCSLLDDRTFLMRHDQHCCESVSIDDICGDLSDLLFTPILLADERTSEENPKEDDGYEDRSFTWTFYELRTIKGSVTIRWYGTSNGYYSEGVSFYEVFPR